MKAVVIGGTGFIGLNVIEALKVAGHEVVATRRSSSNTIFLRRLKVPLRPIKLDDPASITAAIEGCDTVFFVAGHYPRLSLDTPAQVAQAVGDLRAVLAAVKGTGKRFVYTGSIVTVAAPKDDRPAVESDGVPAEVPEGSTYFAIKLALEAEVEAAVREGLDAVTLLPTGCFGPYDHKVGTGFFVVALAHQKLPAYVDGKINVVDVRDVAHAHVAAATSGKSGERYILGGHNLMVRDLVGHLAQRMEVPAPARVLPVDEALAFATSEELRVQGTPERPGLSREMVEMALHGLHVDSGKARADLGFQPRPLEETLGASYEWYRQNGYIRRNP